MFATCNAGQTVAIVTQCANNIMRSWKILFRRNSASCAHPCAVSTCYVVKSSWCVRNAASANWCSSARIRHSYVGTVHIILAFRNFRHGHWRQLVSHGRRMTPSPESKDISVKCQALWTILRPMNGANDANQARINRSQPMRPSKRQKSNE